MSTRKWVTLIHVLVALLPGISTVRALIPPGSCSAESAVEISRDYGLISASEFILTTNQTCVLWHIESPSNQKVIARLLLKGFDKEACDSGYALKLGPAPVISACNMATSKNLPIMYRSSFGQIWVEYLKGSVKRFNQPDFLLEFVTNDSASCQHYCSDSTCVLEHWLCNGVPECGGGEDEAQCTTQPDTVTSSPVIPCVRCYLSVAQGVACVPEALLCDGRYDCISGQDEDAAICSNLKPMMAPVLGTCAFEEIDCIQMNQNESSCLHNALKCDGIPQCIQGEDEDPSICGPLQLCNRRLNDQYGWFASPNFPQPYPSDSNCSWVIHQLGAPESSVIQLRVVIFQLEVMSLGFVTIYDGPDSSYPAIGTYTKLKIPPDLIQSSSNWLNIVFHAKSVTSGSPGFNFTYQMKGVCLPNQSPCVRENECYDAHQKCNGVWDCRKYGSDEFGCEKCQSQFINLYYCGVLEQCYQFSERCNGIAKCPNCADENGCTAQQCGSQNGTFLCDNNRCIYESWTCDHHDDCGDMSDEKFCPGMATTKRVIIAAICGSMICALLLVILVGCSCKLYSLRTMDYSRHPRHETPMSRLYAELLRRRAPPPYHEAMLTSRNFDEVQQEYMEQLRNASRRSRRSGRGNRRRSSQHRQDSGTNADQSSDSSNQGSRNENPNRTSRANSLQLCSIHEENETEALDRNDNESSTADLLPSDSDSDYTDSADDLDTNIDHHREGEGHGSDGQINVDREDNQGVDNDDENDDDDDENILDSESLSARWQRNADSDGASDEECLLADDLETRSDLGSQQGRNNRDCDSLDTEASASILSMDTQDSGGQNVEENKESDDDVGQNSLDSESENSRNSTPKPENCHSNLLISGPGGSLLMRANSHSSLNSVGSETYSDSEVPLQLIGSS